MKFNNFSFKIGMAALLLVFTFSTYMSVNAGSYATVLQKNLADKVIRFHVIANSDSDNDQSLKMLVKKAVVDYIYNNTIGCTSIDETRDFLNSNCDEIVEITYEVIDNYGYDYDVKAGLTFSEFPEKSYGDVTFPEGLYETFTITIGEGAGKNWWCVLYPPLCFVDASSGILPDSSKEILQKELTDEEYAAICDNCSPTDNDNVTFRFKYLTFLNGLFE